MNETRAMLHMDVEDERDKYKRQRDRAMEYVDHKYGCESLRRYGAIVFECTCGLKELREEIKNDNNIN